MDIEKGEESATMLPASKCSSRGGCRHGCSSNSTPNGFDFARDRFPYCIVWTPLPLISWFLPFIGHVGICTSDGIIHDFAGPYTVTEDHMAFGRPLKLVRLNPALAKGGVSWDDAVKEGSKEYRGRMHNLCFDNCHSHVADCLNRMRYGGRSDWNMFKVGIVLTLRSRYISTKALLKTYFPFLIILCIIMVVCVSIYA